MATKNLIKNFFDKFQNILLKNTKNFSGPVVVYSSILPVCISNNLSPKKVSDKLLKIFKISLKKNNLFMPTFFESKNLKVINLDTTKSTCGYLTEYFRLYKGAYRTKCPFFPFAVMGPEAKNFQKINSYEVWGKHSLTHYLYKKNAKIITIGLNPSVCSISHISEWKNRNIIDYRKIKIIKKQLILDGIKENFEKKLFIKKKSTVNNFENYVDDYIKLGMKIYNLNEVTISFMNARKKIDFLTKKIQNDKYAVIKKK